MVNKKYNIIYIDCPWKYNARNNTSTKYGGGVTDKYPTMSLEEIKQINIPSIADDNCALFMWATSSTGDSNLSEKLALFEHWGFKLVNIGFTWVKTNPKSNTPFFGVGYYTKCLSGDSNVYIQDNNGYISKITLQDLYKLNYSQYKIWSHSGWKSIYNMVKNDNTKTVKIKTNIGDIVCSHNHKLFYKYVSHPRINNSNKRKTEHRIDFNTIDYIKEKRLKQKRSKLGVSLLYANTPFESSNPITSLNNIDLDYNLGWVIGLFCAEGNYAKNQIRFTLNSNEIDFYNKIKNTIDNLNLKQDRYFNYNVNVNLYKDKTSNSISVYFSSNIVKNIFQQIILNTGSHNKRLNIEWLYNCSIDFRRGILDGMLDGDGYKEHKKYNRMTLCNENLIDDYIELSNTLGIQSVKKFMKQSSKNTLAKQILYPQYKQVYNRLDGSLELDNNKVQSVSILDIEDYKTIDTYDLTVEDEAFVVNNIISHNSNAEHCFLGIKGKMKPISNSVSSLVISPREKHSKKPDIIRDKIVELFGDLPRVELFARQSSEGWDSIGNEIDGQDIREVLKYDN